MKKTCAIIASACAALVFAAAAADGRATIRDEQGRKQGTRVVDSNARRHIAIRSGALH